MLYFTAVAITYAVALAILVLLAVSTPSVDAAGPCRARPTYTPSTAYRLHADGVATDLVYRSAADAHAWARAYNKALGVERYAVRAD